MVVVNVGIRGHRRVGTDCHDATFEHRLVDEPSSFEERRRPHIGNVGPQELRPRLPRPVRGCGAVLRGLAASISPKKVGERRAAEARL